MLIETPPNMARGPIQSQASLGSGLFFEESGHPRLRKNPATLKAKSQLAWWIYGSIDMDLWIEPKISLQGTSP